LTYIDSKAVTDIAVDGFVRQNVQQFVLGDDSVCFPVAGGSGMRPELRGAILDSLSEKRELSGDPVLHQRQFVHGFVGRLQSQR